MGRVMVLARRGLGEERLHVKLDELSLVSVERPRFPFGSRCRNVHLHAGMVVNSDVKVAGGDVRSDVPNGILGRYVPVIGLKLMG